MTKRIVFEESGHYYTKANGTSTEVSPGGSATDPNAIHKTTAGEIAAITLKEAPGASDVVLIEDASAGNAKRRVTVASLSGSGGVPEAPNDGKLYGRKSAGWVEATATAVGADASGAATAAVGSHVSGTTHLPDAASDGKQYARKDGAWSEVVSGSGLTHAQVMSRVILVF
jgi:hypothetical protein